MDELQLRMIALQSATRAVAAREEKENMAKSMNNQTVMDVVGEEKENQQEQMDANSKDTGMQVFFLEYDYKPSEGRLQKTLLINGEHIFFGVD